jgi:predicted enzyme related to lactoylglutathione lyase
MGNAVTHFEIVGADAEALQSFYRDAFGWEMKASVPGYAMAMTGAAGINGGVGTLPGPARSHVTVYVESDDPAADLGRIEALGGTTVLPATAIPNGPTIALFADPEGHVVGLAKRPDQPMR